MRKRKFKEMWPSLYMLNYLRNSVDKRAQMDEQTLTITYKIRDYQKLPYNKRGMSNVWVKKKMSMEEARRIFLDLHPSGSLV